MFTSNTLRHLLIENEVGYELFGLLVFFFEMFEAAYFSNAHATMLFFQRRKICSVIPSLRVTSATGVPDFACCKAIAICALVYRFRFIFCSFSQMQDNIFSHIPTGSRNGVKVSCPESLTAAITTVLRCRSIPTCHTKIPPAW